MGEGTNDKLICLAIDVKNRACGLVGYDVAFTRRRSGVRIAPGPSFFLQSEALEPSSGLLSDTRIIVKKKLTDLTYNICKPRRLVKPMQAG